MAGGMFPSRGMSLEQRSRLSGLGATRGAHRRHCWVTGPDEDPGPWPGLVLHWQHSPTGWQAWVVYLVGEGEGELVVQGWIGRERLTPAE
jgi:hypothetical protein